MPGRRGDRRDPVGLHGGVALGVAVGVGAVVGAGWFVAVAVTTAEDGEAAGDGPMSPPVDDAPGSALQPSMIEAATIKVA